MGTPSTAAERSPSGGGRGPRRLSIAGFLAIVVVYLAIVKGAGALMESGVVLLLLGALCVGLAEEGMFRGIGVTAFRRHGFSEARVALWSSVVFGAVHLTNALMSGTVIDDRTYAGGIAAILASPVVAIILFARRRRIEPTAAPSRAATCCCTEVGRPAPSP